MPDNIPPGVASNGEQVRRGFTNTAENLKAAAGAAQEQLRARARTASDTARARAQEAGTWAKSQWAGVQGRVESQPQTAALWALGIGVVAGILLGAVLRGNGRD